MLERQSYECPNGAAQCYRLRASYSPPQLTLPIDSPFNLVPHHRPYFVRFQSLAEEGSGLAVLYADRCAKCIDDIEAMDAGPITEISQFLSTVLVLQGVEDIDSATKTTLIKSFKKLEHRHRHVFAAETLRRCIDMVEDSRAMREMFMFAKDMIKAPYKECGAKSCKVREGHRGQKLMPCSKCKAALYCSAEHQRAAWSSHKGTYFPSSF